MLLCFEFADSELAPIAVSQAVSDAGAGTPTALSLVFAAACVVEMSGGAVVRRPGHARGLRLVLEGTDFPPSAVWAEALGRVREGAVQCEGDVPLPRLPLDWASTRGPVRLALVLAHGVVLQLAAERARLVRDPGFAVFESFAC